MKHSYIRILIWSVIAVVLTALLVILLVKPDLLPTPQISLPSVSSYTYDNAGRYTAGSGSVTGVTAVDVEWLDGRVEILPCEGDAVTFDETCAVVPGDQETLRWYNENGTLHIRYANSGLRITNNLNKVLTLRLPDGVQYTELNVETVSGEISICPLSAAEADIDTVSGAITLDELTVRKADISSISGEIDAALSCSEIDAETTSGDVTLRCLQAPREIDVSTVSGATALHLPEDTGFTAKFSTVSGEFTSDFSTLTRDKTYVAGNGATVIDAESVSGDLDIIPLSGASRPVSPAGSAA